MHAVRQWRKDGMQVCYTVDAGANVHVICPEHEAHVIDKRLREIKGVENVLVANAGGAASIIENGD
jgi:diphosphomevalonate decarboxylase